MRFIREANAYECSACGAQQFRRSPFRAIFLGIGKVLLVIVAIVAILFGIAFVGCLIKFSRG